MLRARRLVRRAARRGFTLVELLTAVAIVALGMSLAAPKMSEIIAARKVRLVAQNVLEGINIARAEAVRRNTEVQFALVNGGWKISTVSPATTLRTSSNIAWGPSLVVSSSANSTVSFVATGLRGSTGTQMSQVDVSSTVPRAGARRINIFGGGLIRMCDPGVTAANDPRRC